MPVADTARRLVIQAPTELEECDRIWALDEQEINRKLVAAGIDLAGILQRIEKIAAAAERPVRPQGASRRTCPARVTAAGSAMALAELDEPSPREAAPPAIADDMKADVEIFEIAGTIKWFDVSKGYGFITPDNGLADVLLHVTCLRAAGLQTAFEDARVHCQVLKRPRGLQAFRILSMDESTAIHPSQLPARTHVDVAPESGWEVAAVKWYNRVRGFGFLARGPGTPDIFVHAETLRRFGFAELKPGQTVEVRWGMGAKGCMAAELRPGNGRLGSLVSH